MHEIPLITTIALALSAALFFGLIARRLGLSPIVGYLIAGVLIGPYTPGVVGDAKIASQLAEIGVILLMFGVGLHFSLKDLLAVRSLAIPGALAQSIAATLACMGLAVAMGWSWQSGLILGIAVSVASTVVMLRALLDHGIVETAEGNRDRLAGGAGHRHRARARAGAGGGCRRWRIKYRPHHCDRGGEARVA